MKRSNASMRYDPDGPTPAEAEARKRDRHATAAIIGTLGALALMLAHMAGVGL
jgi:hypothetical protein